MEAEDFQFEQDTPRRQVSKLRFDGTINLGHILTAVMMSAAILTMWVNTKVTEAEHDSRLKVLEKSQVRIDETVTKLAENAASSQRTQDKLSLTLDFLAKQISNKP